ncbi:exportin-5-like [Xenia sp. Carnegie-2017]|uniref:exportin-5-like n=1 Tax=Xenia sp. Carnegie-2017 TaxID=2897299 RepID=UPI001F03D1D8|nr:exportin-5-like [Xenia sp. Carnegie-2017]
MSLFNEMREDGQLHYISQKLAESVEIILNPSSSHDKRLQATKFCEEFKESKTNLLQCGHYLYKSRNNFVVKHFGLQLIHHGIRVNWNNMTHKEKNDLKSLALKHIKTNPVSLLDEPTYLKDAIAKYAVEIMKREWPQNWPDVINQLGDIAQQGPSQLFTVLRTLLFLAEDVTNADGDLPSERRKDMMSAMNVIIEDLFKFFVKTLRNTAETLKSLKMQNDDELNRQILENKLLAETSLNTLCGYVDWVNIIYIVQENALLLQTLCLLLRYNELRLKAAECFEGVVMRKGPTTERVPLLILFSMDALSLIFSSITDIIKSHNDDLNEENHIFLKRVCNILSSLGQLQLANIWGSPNHADIDEPVHFDVYLQALIFLYKHKNMIMSDLISKTYLAFLTNKTICKNATFCSYIPQILEISKTKISRGLHPALNSSNLLYPDVDFGSFAEKYTAWTNLRKSTKDIIQDITSLYPSDAFLHTASWLVNLTSTPITTQVSENSVEYCEWDSLASFTSSVVNRLFKNGISFVKEFNECRLKMGDTFISFGDLAKKCIESLLRYNTEALLIQNIVLQMLESFIPFLEIHSELLLKLVYKLFTAVVYKPSDGEDCQSLKSSEYRRSAGSIWIRLCLTHNKLMINIIDDLTKQVELTFIGYNDMTMEKSFMMEGLVAISNGFSHYEKQSAYLKQIMNPVKEQWTSAEIEHALLSPEAF